MRLYLIRHSLTDGNLKKRYIGTTDEPLCEAGIELLRDRNYPKAKALYVSPMLRCRQTAALIYPGQEYEVVEDLRECDFGLFENKNYEELSDCPQYQEWVDSGGTLAFPGGESREAFQNRTLGAFERILRGCGRSQVQTAALVIHGGSIMSIMERYAYPPGEYYDYQVGNGEGYELEFETGRSCRISV